MQVLKQLVELARRARPHLLFAEPPLSRWKRSDFAKLFGLGRDLDFHPPISLASCLRVIGRHGRGLSKPDHVDAAVGYAALEQ
jgi:hypothetical protein